MPFNPDLILSSTCMPPVETVISVSLHKFMRIAHVPFFFYLDHAQGCTRAKCRRWAARPRPRAYPFIYILVMIMAGVLLLIFCHFVASCCPASACSDHHHTRVSRSLLDLAQVCGPRVQIRVAVDQGPGGAAGDARRHHHVHRGAVGG